MGRRALRKIDPLLDLSRHLHEARGVTSEWGPATWFDRPGPLEIEVGSGKGLFLAQASVDHPERNYLGIEISARYARFAAARLARLNVDNGVVFHGDAQLFFQEHVRAEVADAVHIYFPDPWWKKRHHKRRIMNATFIEHVARTLIRGGTLHFWTDVADYFEESLALLAQFHQLSGPHPIDELPADHDLDYRTHFERRMRLHARPVQRAFFSKM